MFSQRLRLARKKAGLSMRALAERLSPPLSAQAISKYEAGEMMPSSSVLVGLGRALDVSLDFLMGAQVEALEGIEFRKHSRTSAQDRARAEAIVTEKLEDYLIIEAILGLETHEDPFADLRRESVASFAEIEDAAEALRIAWALGTDPIPSVTALLEDKGIRVIEADLPDRFHGLACTVKRAAGMPDTEAVVVSRAATVERKRFTLAHELAHRLIRASSSPEIKLEKAMHRFAGSFLVPLQHLKTEVGGPRQGITWHELIRLKRFYGISASAMLIRLRDAEILPSAAVEYAFRTYARGWRAREPEPMTDGEGFGAFEKPRRFERLIYRALGEELITPVRAAELLKLPLRELERQIRGPAEP